MILAEMKEITPLESQSKRCFIKFKPPQSTLDPPTPLRRFGELTPSVRCKGLTEPEPCNLWQTAKGRYGLRSFGSYSRRCRFVQCRVVLKYQANGCLKNCRRGLFVPKVYPPKSLPLTSEALPLLNLWQMLSKKRPLANRKRSFENVFYLFWVKRLSKLHAPPPNAASIKKIKLNNIAGSPPLVSGRKEKWNIK